MHPRFKIATTDNTIKPQLDLNRLGGLARRYLEKQQPGSGDDPIEVLQQTQMFVTAYSRSQHAGGICGGMVAWWSFGYLLGSDPEKPPSPQHSEALQQHSATTLFKRAHMGKSDPVPAARAKMYGHLGLQATTCIPARQMPAKTFQYPGTIAEITDAVVEGVPFLLSITIKEGKHALGLIWDKARFYVLEPNQGIFRFMDKPRFTAELNNWCVKNLAPASPYELMRIGNAG